VDEAGYSSQNCGKQNDVDDGHRKWVTRTANALYEMSEREKETGSLADPSRL